MKEIIVELKDKKVLYFIMAIGIVFVVIVFLIYVLSDKKEKPTISVAPIALKEEKSALESLSEPIIDSSGKPITENYLQYLPQPSLSIFPSNSKEKK